MTKLLILLLLTTLGASCSKDEITASDIVDAGPTEETGGGAGGGAGGGSYEFVFTSAPTSENTALVFSTQPVVAIQSSAVTQTSETATVKIEAYSNASCTTAAGGVLGGTTSLATASGVATFTNLTYDTAGTIYLKASATTSSVTIASECSNAITLVSPGPIATSDSFDRANSNTTLGSTDMANGGSTMSWIANNGTWGISSNRAYLASATGIPTALVNSGYKNGFVQLTLKEAVPAAGSNDGSGIFFRSDAQGENGFGFVAGAAPAGTLYNLVKFAGGNPIGTLASYYPAGGTAVGDVLRATFDGPYINLSVNGETIIKYFDIEYLSNDHHGMITTGSTLMIDDFAIGNATNDGRTITSDTFTTGSLATTNAASGGAAMAWTIANGTFTTVPGDNSVYSATAVGAGFPMATALLSTSHSDLAIQATLKALPNAMEGLALIFRASSDLDYWAVVAFNDGSSTPPERYSLFRIPANDLMSGTSYGEYATMAANDVIRVELSGPFIVVKINGTVQMSAYSMSNINETKHGIGGVGPTSARLSNFLIENATTNSTVTLSDSFNRSNGVIGKSDIITGGNIQEWETAGGSWTISSNQVASTTVTSSFALAYQRADRDFKFDSGNFSNDTKTWNCTVEASLPVIPTANSTEAGILLRYIDANNYVRAVLEVGAGGAKTYKIIQVLSSVATTLATSSGITPADGDLLRAHVSGRAVSLSVNGTSIGAGSIDSSLTDPNFGLISSSTTARFDNFKVYDCNANAYEEDYLTSDSFTGAAGTAILKTDASAGGVVFNWINPVSNHAPDAQISANQYSSINNYEGVSVNSGKTNCTLEIKAAVMASDEIGISFRANADCSESYYTLIDKTNNQVELVYHNSGGGGGGIGGFVPAPASGSIADGDTFKFKFVGTELKVYRNDIEMVVSWGTSAINYLSGHGKHGFNIGSNTNDRVDDFKLVDCVD